MGNHCTQSCARRLHLQSYFSKRTSNTHCSKDSTPRLAPKVTLNSNWQSQEQQPVGKDVSCTSFLVHDRTERRDDMENTTDDQTRTRRLVQEFEPDVEKKPQFEIDLGVEGASQDAISQDEAKMIEITEMLEVKIWIVHKISVCDDMPKGTNIFSEESRRAIYDMGNM